MFLANLMIPDTKQLKHRKLISCFKINMLFILGARCTDGVVLIGDTKFIIDRGIDLI